MQAVTARARRRARAGVVACVDGRLVVLIRRLAPSPLSHKPREADFNGTLTLRSRYNAIAALAKAGIRPSNSATFSITQFRDALQNAYGGNIDVRVSCDANAAIQEM